MDLFKPGFLPTLLYFAGDYGAAGPRGAHEARHRPPSQEPCQPFSASQLSRFLCLSVCLFAGQLNLHNRRLLFLDLAPSYLVLLSVKSDCTTFLPRVSIIHFISDVLPMIYDISRWDCLLITGFIYIFWFWHTNISRITLLMTLKIVTPKHAYSC